jgi:hypothetical protein
MGNDKTGNDKSILEKIADTVKDIANIAADAADHALKPEESAPKVDEPEINHMPLAAEGLVSDPMLVPPMAPAPAQKKKAANKTSRKSTKPIKAAMGRNR